ncbi:hypothetical protein KKG22_05375 [Patescibacteria group bacterium]|nr:hypothetical protein [Patescibacteria group bacterium]MBU1721547.1 hypothetical protein [Patescibacteria group bacterium]MBU1901475.1 hypothetical protein [Patescibacteria group bacterium]
MKLKEIKFMKSKKTIIYIVSTILTLFLILKFAVFFTLAGRGDVVGGEKLEYIFAKGEFLCDLVGGERDKIVMGWSDKVRYECLVTNELVCSLYGGIKGKDLDERRKMWIMQGENACYKK